MKTKHQDTKIKSRTGKRAAKKERQTGLRDNYISRHTGADAGIWVLSGNPFKQET